MTKQKEIREGIARDFLLDIWKEAKSSTGDSWDDVQWESLSEKHQEEYLKTASRLLFYLHSQGVVIKVKGELPKVIMESAREVSRAIGQDFIEGRITYEDYVNKFDEVFAYAQAKLEFAGCVTVELLIEEVKK